MFNVETQAERNVYILSISFLLIFSGWSASFAFATTKNGEVGAFSVGLIFISISLSNLFIVPLLNTASPRIVMFFSSITYLLYISSNIVLHPLIFHHRLVLYFLSISLGFGAASILISQTLFVNRSANIYERQKGLPINSKLGYFNGIFLMFFFVNKLTGYLISAVLFAYGLHEDIVFAVLSTLCLCGSLGLLMISDTDSPGIDVEDPESERLMDERAKSETASLSLSGSVASVADVKTNVSKMISLWKSTKFLSLAGFTIFTGVDMEFVSGEFPLFFSDKSTKFFVLALSGLSASASSFVLGKLSDSKLSRIQILKAGFVCKLMVYLYLYWNIKPLWMLYTSDSDQIVHENPDIQRECELVVYGLVLCAALMGIGDGCLLVQEPAMYVLMLGNHPEVFASMRVWKGLAAAACYFLHSFFTLPEKVLINLALVILSFLPLNYCAVRQRLN